MAITNGSAIKFCNERARPGSDLLAQAFYHAQAFANNWTQNQSLALYGAQCRDTADRIADAFFESYKTVMVWGLGVNAVITNDATQIWDNGPNTAQDPTRPPLVGSQVNTTITRMNEFQNWLQSATQSFTDALRNNAAALNSVLIVSNKYGRISLIQADAVTFATRCAELIANYSASSNANLGTVLSVAVNPNA